MKQIFLVLVLLLLLLGAGGAGFLYYEGMPYVDYALRRGSGGNPLAPPGAFEDVYSYANKYPSGQPKAPPFEQAEWTLTSFDGLKLSATHFVPQSAESHRWAILIHGYGCNQRFMWSMADYYLRRGYHVLTPDMRASGRSEGRYLTMGALEGRDVAAWARAVASEDPEAHIVLHGVSMGAADVMLALGDGIPAQVKAVVEDSGYSDLRALLQYRMDELGISHDRLLLAAANVLMKLRTGADFDEVRPVEAVANSSVPILFIHGTRDELIPVSMMYVLAGRSAARDKEAVPVEGARHAAGESLGRPYYDTVFAFVEKYV